MKILLLGKNGQVGWELQRALQPLGTVRALDRNMDSSYHLSGDVADFAAIEKVFAEFVPNIVVNATAYTAVDKAQSDQAQADLINHLAVKNLAEQCLKIDALLIHYSTDYVFDGTGSKPWQENDVTAPINYYGVSKRQGELALEQSGVKFINFRTSWVYGSHGNNFIKTMLKLAKTKETLSIINDQVGAPTGAALIADVTAQVIRYYTFQSSSQDNLCGHYHLAATGYTSWFKYAQFIFDIAKAKAVPLAIQSVQAIETIEYPTPAQRPLNSRLNTTKLQRTFELNLPDWRLGVEHVLGELI